MSTKLIGIAVLPLLAGCGLAYGAGVGVHYEEGYQRGPVYEDSYGGGVGYDATYGRRVNYRRLPVARRFLPAPGRCRVWLPGVAPAYQPRTSSCRTAERRVPRGGWLLVRPNRYPGVVELIAADYRGRGVRTRYVYNVRTGRRVNRHY